MSEPVVAVDPTVEPGKFTCIRPAAGGIQFSDLRPARGVPNRDLYSCLYTINVSADRRLAFYLPLVDRNRAWSTQRGAWLIINHILDSDLDDWTFVEMSSLHGVKAAKIDIKASELRVEKPVSAGDGLLVVMPIWRVWFSQEEGHGNFPLRVEREVTYEFQGKTYPLIHSGSSKSMTVFEAFDITEFSEGLYYPKRGVETTYFPRDMKSANADEIAEQISLTGKFVSDFESVTHSSREWFVHELTLIGPTEDLWIDPPKLAQIHDVATGSRSVVGVSVEESKSRLNGDFLIGKDLGYMKGKNSNSTRKFLLAGNLIFFILIAWFTWRSKRVARAN